MNDFDLSIGAVASFCGSLAFVLAVTYSIPWVLALFLGLLLGAFIGLVHGVLVARVGASSFIITLAAGSVYGGLELYITDQSQIFSGVPGSLLALGQGELLGVRAPIIYAVVVALILHIFVHRSVPGRQMQAIGDNIVAARFSGLSVTTLRISGFVFSATLSAFAGIVLFARAGGTYTNAGAPVLLPAFAAVFLGAAMLGRGRFNVLGTALAVVSLRMVSSGLIISQLPSWTTNVFEGSILATAILIAAIQDPDT